MKAASSKKDASLHIDKNKTQCEIQDIMKTCLPTDCQVDEEASLFVYKCAQEFVSAISSEASSKCAHDMRTRLSHSDVLYALANLGYLNYHDALSLPPPLAAVSVAASATTNTDRVATTKTATSTSAVCDNAIIEE